MFRVVFAGLLLGCFCPTGILGQAVSGAINGYVLDGSGAPVANASVNIANEQTGVEKKTSTDAGGFYNATSLTPGQYSVSVEQKGFSSFLKKQITLNVDATVRIDVKLQLGAMSQTITVAAGAELLQTEKSDV
jgi:uncharacterized membrane protein